MLQLKRYSFILPLFIVIVVAIVDLFWSRSSGTFGFTDMQAIFYDFRLPRVLGAIFAGIALSLSGLALQTLFRNPLAGPFLTGITPGASFMIAVVLLLFPLGIQNPVLQEMGITGAGVLGGIAVLLLQIIISRKSRGIFTLLLTGVMISYLFGAAVEMMQNVANAEQIRSFVMWGLGNFDRVQLTQIRWFAPLVLICAVILILFRFQLDAWLPGELYARNAGIDTQKLKVISICIAGILAGSTTAICGPIGFVGLAAPHLSRIITGSNNHTSIFFPTALWGIALCLVADLVAHNIFANLTLNVNAVCALIGAPIVLWIILRSKQ